MTANLTEATTAGKAGYRTKGTLGDDGVMRFLGIPYAEPPVGPKRFLAARPHPGWTGTRPADELGAASLQGRDPILDLIPGMAEVNGPRADTDEDCLTLNIWTSAIEAAQPVFVWIHGGGFLTGSGGGTWYDGARFAARHGMVYVSINYRLGILGLVDVRYSDDPQAADSCSLALRDQLTALEWIQEHIAEYGGDPTRVTIAGESAGAMSVIALLAMPQSDGLIHRAIAQSGHGEWVLDEEASAARTRHVLATLGIRSGAGALAALQDVPSDRFVPLREEAGFGPLPPAISHDWLCETPATAFASRRSAQVPLIIGTNTDETKSLRQIAGLPEDVASFADRLRNAGYGRASRQIETLYRRQGADTDSALWDRVTSDRDWHARVRSLALTRSAAEVAPTYVYRFNWPTQAIGGALGTSHMAEIPFALDNLKFGARTGMYNATLDSDPSAVRQSAAMAGAWSEFARSGDPRASLSVWQPFSADRESTLFFNVGTSECIANLDRNRLDYWSNFGPGPDSDIR